MPCYFSSTVQPIRTLSSRNVHIINKSVLWHILKKNLLWDIRTVPTAKEQVYNMYITFSCFAEIPWSLTSIASRYVHYFTNYDVFFYCTIHWKMTNKENCSIRLPFVSFQSSTEYFKSRLFYTLDIWCIHELLCNNKVNYLAEYLEFWKQIAIFENSLAFKCQETYVKIGVTRERIL